MNENKYLQQQISNIQVGMLGEKWVAKNEIEKMANTPYSNMVNFEYGKGKCCYDGRSVTADGKMKIIEVKTTAGDKDRAFFMTAPELELLHECDESSTPYELHRVHNVSRPEKCGEVVLTPQQLLENYIIKPANYILIPKDSLESGYEADELVFWETSVTRIPNTTCKIYLAKIVGPHPDYRFSRFFQKGHYEYESDKIWVSFELDPNGVYELGAKWTDNESGQNIKAEKKWFELNDGFETALQYHEVLNAAVQIRCKMTA